MITDLFSRVTEGGKEIIETLKKNEHVEKILNAATALQMSLKDFFSNNDSLREFFPNILKKFSSKDSTIKENKSILKIKQNAQDKLSKIFSNFESRKLLPGSEIKFENFEDNGKLSNLIHPLEKERFEKLKENKALRFALSVLGSTHANLTTFAEIPDRSFIVTEKTFPRLYKLHMEVHKALNIQKEYHLFCRMDYSRNAKTFGTDENCLIVIDSSCLEDFSDDQIKALLGRELAHIKFKHINYLTAFSLIDDVLNLVPLPQFLRGTIDAAAVSTAKGLLLEWLLAAEFSADRAAAFVAGDILPVIKNNLMISGLETAPSAESYKLYIQDELNQDINTIDNKMKLLMTNTLQGFPMPFVIPRIKELTKWGTSDACKNNFPEIHSASSKSENKKPVQKSAPVNLSKGQRFHLKKNNCITVKFEWDATKLDIEHCAFLLNQNEKVKNDEDFIFFNNHKSLSEGVVYFPQENNSGQIKINLMKIPTSVKKITLVLMICDAEQQGQNFSMVKNIHLKISGDEELAIFPLENFTAETVIIGGEIYRNKDEWKFNAVGSGWNGGIEFLCKNFGVKIE